MPIQRIRLSSKSGDVIPENTGGRVRIQFGDLTTSARDRGRLDMRADLTDAELDKLIAEFGFTEVEPREAPRTRRSRR